MKAIVLSVTALALITLGGLGLASLLKGAGAVQLVSQGFPSMGNPNAKVELVLFEDLRCSGCFYFEEEIYPKIAANYIVTGKVRYTAVPLAFLNDSKIRANAAWAVYMQNPEQFFPYVHELYRYGNKDEIDKDTLLYLAKKVGGINLDLLADCIDSGCYYGVLDKNTEWAKELMGKDFGTPVLFINGVRAPIRSFESVKVLIDRALKAAS